MPQLYKDIYYDNDVYNQWCFYFPYSGQDWQQTHHQQQVQLQMDGLIPSIQGMFSLVYLCFWWSGASEWIDKGI